MKLAAPPPDSFGFFASLSFFYKLLASFALVVILPVVGLSIYSYVMEREHAVEQEIATLSANSRKIADDIDKYLLANQNLVRHLALNGEVENFLRKKTRSNMEIKAFHHLLQEQLSISPEYNVLYVLDMQGTCLAATDTSFIGQNYAVRYYFREALKGRVYKSDWSIGLTSGEPGIYFSAPVTAEGHTVGVMVLKLRVTRIQDLVAIWKLQDKDAVLLNGAGVILTHTRPEYNYRALIELTTAEQARIADNRQFADKKIESLGLQEVRKALDRSLSGKQTEIVKYRFQDREKLLALSSLKEQNWAVAVAVPESLVYSQSNLILRNTLVFSLLSMSAAIAVGVLMGRLIALPIRRLTHTVNRFGAGHAEVRAEVESADEIGQLAASFNRMAATISDYMHGLEDKVRERTRELERLNAELKNISVHDALTGCYNRRYLYEQLGNEIARAKRHGLGLSVIMCDLDYFKAVNDEYGHLAGDAVLRAFGGLLLEMSRDHIDCVARYGGEEFVLLLPDTDLEGGIKLAERLRTAFDNQPVRIGAGQEAHVTASFGVTAVYFPSDDRLVTPDALISKADKLLYDAKEAGRNRAKAESF
ncbi:MAG: diguanylate cyclase [Pseudomonadota bacterium]